MKKIFALIATLLTTFVFAQTKTDEAKPLKLHHAEPLYIDLIRDLGARKGEKELNVGFGFNDETSYTAYTGFAEYEFAVANRLGLEVEVPFEIDVANPGYDKYSAPANRVEGIKLATQYTFLVSAKHQTSMAVGYIQEMEFSDIDSLGHAPLFAGTIYNPVFIAAKRLTPNIHALLYTGSSFSHEFATGAVTTSLEVNANLHYVFNNGNFFGLETNMDFSAEKPEIVFRPQFKVGVSKNVSFGVVAALPASHQNHGFGAMTRMIFTP